MDPICEDLLGNYGLLLHNLKLELSVIVARARDHSIRCFPVVETIHRDNICHIVEAPADVPDQIKKLAVEIAQKAIGSLDGAGVFAVELFLTKDKQIVVKMPKGIPVATVAIGNAANAALLAVRILAANDSDLSDRFDILISIGFGTFVNFMNSLGSSNIKMS